MTVQVGTGNALKLLHSIVTSASESRLQAPTDIPSNLRLVPDPLCVPALSKRAPFSVDHDVTWDPDASLGGERQLR